MTPNRNAGTLNVDALRKGDPRVAHDTNYFRQRAAEARTAAFRREEGEDSEIAGQLALAYASLARRKGQASTEAVADELLEPAPALQIP